MILITHASGGGVERQIAASVERHRADGDRAIVLRPSRSPDGARCVTVGDGTADAFPNLRYVMPDELPDLLRLLTRERPRAVELHHLVGHHPAVLDLLGGLGVPYDIHVHDYAWLCGRVALVGPTQRYCGEPAVAQCEACVADAGNLIDEDITVAALRRRSAKLLAGARRVVVPSEDAAARIRRHFPATRPVVQPHENDAALGDPPRAAATTTCRVCVIGAIGIHKGYQVVLDCARDAAERRLPLEFVVVGHTIDDRRLLATGRVFVTGSYAADEVVTLIKAQNATLAMLPSIFPETWCLSLAEAWRAGLRVAAFDIGAQAERIRRTGRGILLPLGLPAHAINNALLAAAGLSRRSMTLIRMSPTLRRLSDSSRERLNRTRPGVNQEERGPECPKLAQLFPSLPQPRPRPRDGGMQNRVAELKVSGHLMTLDTGVFCVFQAPGTPAANDWSGLPGVRISLPPGPAGRPEAISISTFRDDGWMNGSDTAALIRVAEGPAQVLVTVYQSPSAPPETAPRLQVMRLGAETPGCRPRWRARRRRGAVTIRGCRCRGARAAHRRHAGQARRLGRHARQPAWIEGFSLAPREGVKPADIEYQAVLGRGWLSPWIEGGKFCGSRGMALPLLGLKVRLKGNAAKTHECSYSATFVDGSSVGPIPGGETCEAESLAALEAFQVTIHRRGGEARATRDTQAGDQRGQAGTGETCRPSGQAGRQRSALSTDGPPRSSRQPRVAA